jgi:hypothetical protein
LTEQGNYDKAHTNLRNERKNDIRNDLYHFIHTPTD